MVTLLFQSSQNWRQCSMGLDRDRLGAVASDLFQHLARPGANQPCDTTAAGRSDDAREIDVAPHRRAGDDQLALLGKRQCRFVALMFENRHRMSIVVCENRGNSGVGLVLLVHSAMGKHLKPALSAQFKSGSLAPILTRNPALR